MTFPNTDIVVGVRWIAENRYAISTLRMWETRGKIESVGIVAVYGRRGVRWAKTYRRADLVHASTTRRPRRTPVR